MKIEKAFCLFEQSGAFKHAFRAFGISAEDWDIQNEYGETDRIIDLFDAIENAWSGKPSVFDEIGANDLAIAFFPCIYFCDVSQLACTYDYVNYRCLDARAMTERILERQRNREKFLAILVKMFCVFKERGLRLIFENPWTGATFLKHNFVCPPQLIDMNRTLRGDHYKKPTAYWYVNCEPTHGETLHPATSTKTIRHASRGTKAGICGRERSEITETYARLFIADFILNKSIEGTQEDLFNSV